MMAPVNSKGAKTNRLATTNHATRPASRSSGQRHHGVFVSVMGVSYGLYGTVVRSIGAPSKARSANTNQNTTRYGSRYLIISYRSRSSSRIVGLRITHPLL